MSAATLSFADRAAARRMINANLRGPVVEILTRMMPEVARLPRADAFEVIINDCDLLHRCFIAFRARREQFRNLLVDRRHRPVDNGNQPLACGRTLNQIVAMIVRSAAKRHFRFRLGGGLRPAPKRLTLMERLAARFQAPPPRRRLRGAGDRLYDALKLYLLHDWQVPIIPQYARMTPDEVRELGSRILDFRDPAQLARYLDGLHLEGHADLPPPQPHTVDAMGRPEADPSGDARARLSDVLTPDGGRLRAKALVPILIKPEILALAGVPDKETLRALYEALGGTGGGAVKQMVVGFGMTSEQLTVFLAAAVRTLPRPAYDRLFGAGADSALVERILERAEAAGLTQGSPLAAFDAFVRGLFARFAAPAS
jgi:hypothetical protein